MTQRLIALYRPFLGPLKDTILEPSPVVVDAYSPASPFV
jgi:hypothetical protein